MNTLMNGKFKITIRNVFNFTFDQFNGSFLIINFYFKKCTYHILLNGRVYILKINICIEIAFYFFYILY